MTNVIFTGYFNILFLFVSIKIPIIVMYGQTDGVENHINTSYIVNYKYNILVHNNERSTLKNL